MAEAPRFTEQTFQEWKAARANRPFFRLLEDQRTQLMLKWGAGEPMSVEAQLKCRLWLTDLLTLEWADIDQFYAPEDGPENAPGESDGR